MLLVLWHISVGTSLLLLAVGLLYLVALYCVHAPLWLYARSKQITQRLLACIEKKELK